ncbi:MAG: hypothetical protein AAFR52_14765 [Pseudomonadota bacterium]
MTKTLMIAAVALVAATGAQAASFGADNSAVAQAAVVVNSTNVSLGQDTFAAQGVNTVCGARNSAIAQATAVINSTNIALGKDSEALQGANHIGSKNCLKR